MHGFWCLAVVICTVALVTLNTYLILSENFPRHLVTLPTLTIFLAGIFATERLFFYRRFLCRSGGKDAG